MGCGCGSGLSKRERIIQKNGGTSGIRDRARTTVKRIWNHVQTDQPTHVVKRINKK